MKYYIIKFMLIFKLKIILELLFHYSIDRNKIYILLFISSKINNLFYLGFDILKWEMFLRNLV